jgi:hypothetical protein
VDQAEKLRENRLRRMAERQGLRLTKSRRREPRALDYPTQAWVLPSALEDQGRLDSAGGDNGRPSVCHRAAAQ